MSNQSLANIGNEKQIASYESEFRENRLAKPQDVSLTITAGHLHGRAFIWEREGTKEGDAEYQRFTCSLEEITKVYINENVKANPLYIQCDSSVKGVFHRKTIVVPCLENASAVVEQINTVRSQYMEKFEAQQQREMERKRAALEAERLREQAEAKSGSDDLPPVDKFADAVMKSEEPAAAPLSMSSEVGESIKALEKLESIDTITSEIPVEAAVETVSPIQELPPVLSIDDELPPVHEIPAADELIESFAAEGAPAPAAPKAASVSLLEQLSGEFDELSALAEQSSHSAAASVMTVPPEVASVTVPAPVIAEPEPEPIPAPEPEPELPGLEGFEMSVMALKEKLDNGDITFDVFKEERKKLIASLY